MKRKGITIWEQYLERIVLGAAVLFFIGFTVFQAISEPNVKDGIAPSEIKDELQSVANRLSARLSDDAPPTLSLPSYQPVSDRFAAELDAGISPSERLAVSSPQLALRTGSAEAGENTEYHIPEFPAPTLAVARQTYDAIEPEVVSLYEGLAERFDEAPYDTTWMTVFAVLSLEEMRRELASSRGGAVVPTHWAEAVDYLDLRLVREELVDGEWTNQTEVETPPGMLSYRERLRSELSKRDAQALRDEARVDGVRKLILRPDFYDTVAGNWLPEDPRSGQDDGEEIAEDDPDAHKKDRLRRLERTLRDLHQRRVQIERTASENGINLSCQEEEEEEERPGRGDEEDEDGGRIPGRKGGSGGGVAPPGAGVGATGSGESNRRQQERLKETLERACKQIARRIGAAERDIDNLREELGMTPMDETDIAVIEDNPDVFEDDEVVIWGFDLDIEPGSTYRYRVTVDVFNPFHGKMLHLVPSQQHLAKTISMSTASSEWTDAVEVQPPTRVFITRAMRDRRDQEVTRATAEVYRFLDGRWWSSRFNIEPGARLGQPRSPGRNAGSNAPEMIDFSTPWYVLDIERDIDATEDDVAGVVYLQDVMRPGRYILRDPRRDLRDPDRLRLKELVDAADGAAIDVALGEPGAG